MLDSCDNLVLPFQLESSHLRGRLTCLGSTLDLILSQHAYPDPVAQLLAEATAVAAALASSLKYEGVFTLQTKSDGAVRMLVVDVTHTGGVRAYAQYDAERLDPAVAPHSLLGTGYLAFTCALAGRDDRYQGIVALEGESLSASVQHYFRQSEQVPTGIMTAAARDDRGHWRSGCLLLQKMPREGGINVENHTPETEDWHRAMIVMGTCTSAELTDGELGAETLLYRLFHEEGVRVYAAQHLVHQCRCSQERVTSMLRSLPRAEIEALAVDDIVTVTCEFCNRSYIYTRQDRAAFDQGTMV